MLILLNVSYLLLFKLVQINWHDTESVITFSCFQLNQNVKTVNQNVNRIMLTLKDNSSIFLDKMPPSLLQKTKEYLEKLKQGKSGDDRCSFKILKEHDCYLEIIYST